MSRIGNFAGKLAGKKKKIITSAIAILLTVALIAGLSIGLHKSATGGTVMVIKAEEMNYGGYGMDDTQIEGTVMSDVSQNIYLNEKTAVKEVNVSEGDSVKEGDVLLIYDEQKVDYTLQKLELEKKQLELEVEVANRNIQRLANMTPISEDDPGYDPDDPGYDPDDPGYDPDDPGEDPDDPGEEDEDPEISDDPSKGHVSPQYKDVILYTAENPLDDKAKAYNEGSGEEELGTEAHPYRFLCEGGDENKEGAVVLPSFLRMMKKKAKGKHLYFVLEVRKGNKVDGDLLMSFVQDASLLGDFDDNWRGHIVGLVNISEQENPDDGSQTDPDDGSQTDPDDGSQTDPGDGSQTDPGDGSQTDPGDGSQTDPGDGSQTDPGDGSQTDPGDGSDNPGDGNGDGTGDSTGVEGISFSGRGGINYEFVALGEDDFDDVIVSSGLIPADAQYTKEELAMAREEEKKRLEDLKLDLEEAALNLKKAKKAIASGEERAKFDGTVTKVGDPENPEEDGSPFMTVSNAEGRYVRSAISELLLGKVKEGDKITITSWQSGASCEATIKEISDFPDMSGEFYSYNANASMYPFIAYMGEGGEGFSDYEWVQIQLNSAKNRTENGSLYLAKAFIRQEGGQKYVYKRGEDGKLVKQNIKTGTLSWDSYQILSGLTGEDWIAFPYGKNVKEGAATREGTTEELWQ